ncbi:MAG: HAMP domain-containing protein [Treponema sp.]|nr:HAMP domain-containing protein [Treponema sp.]
MARHQRNRLSDKFIKFSIGAKLVTIITILVLVSLGLITFLVSYMVRQDLELSAEENNYEINRRSAAETEYTLASVKSNSQILAQIINSAGADSALAKQAAGFFFAENKQIASLVFSSPGQDRHFLINENFFLSRGIDIELVDFYYKSNSSFFNRALAGDSVIKNASPYFSYHLLALFYPMQNGEAMSILFEPENLSGSFGFGVNQSYLINADGDILIHPNQRMVRQAANISNRGYIRFIRDNPVRSRQDLFEDEGVKSFIAYTRLNSGDSIVITSIEYNIIFEGIDATTRRNLYLTAAVVFLSILFIWFFSKSISVALKILANAARKIEGGIFELDLVPKSRDEIGYLTASFQRMSKALSIFGRFTNREIAVKAMRGEIKPGGLPKHATIFFSDIRGFTEKSEIFTNEFGKDASDKIVFWLNNYFTQMVDCVEKTNGVVDKFIGDAVMAHWGTAYSAGSPAKDAFNGVKAALMMRKALVALNKKRIPGDRGDPPIIIGCGINTGIVTAGQLGSDVRMEYTVIGDPVNLASRIESLNKPLGTDILISESTWNHVKYFFITEEMPSVTVKGKEKPVRIFAVINHVSVTSGPKTLKEVRELLGIKAPDISKVDINADEMKYKIGSE